MTPTFDQSGSMFNGSIAALVTPFTDKGEIDVAATDRLVDFHLENHSDGLVIAGTTGESASLAGQEVAVVLKRVIERVAGRIPVIAGTGSASTATAVRQTETACELGADAALVVTPYYNRPPQKGLEAHFRAVADASDIPVLLYNVPSRTSVDLLPATVERLSTHPRIAGIKEAVADQERIQELVKRCAHEFIVLSGDDASCLASMKNGANGVISVAANVAPGPMHELTEVAARQDWAVAEQMNDRLQQLFEVLMIETNPIPVKWSLFAMGLVGPAIRLPLVQMDESKHARVRQVLRDLELVDA